MEIENQNKSREKKLLSKKKRDEEDDMMEEENGSDSFDKMDEDTEDTEDDNTEQESGNSTDEESTEDDDEENDDEEIQLEDDDEDKVSRRTVSTAGRRRNRNFDNLEDETDAGSIVVAPGDDVDVSLHVEALLCRQTFPISRWLSMFSRMNTRYITNGSRLDTERWEDATGEKLQENVQLYMVKWRNLSYLHCSWESEASLMELEGVRMKQKIRNFLKNEANLMFELTAYGADIYFNPDYVEIDRVLDVRIVPKIPGIPFEVENNPDIEALLPSNEYGQQGEFVKEFRIKWKSLPYNEISWEIFEDFQDTEVIDRYYEHLNRDVSEQYHIPSWRPPISEYRKIDGEMEYKGGNKLRSYQVEGANWMIWNWRSGRNSILADEMGLGKTVQSTMFMYNVLKEYNMKYPFLVVAPLSTLPHWEGEIRRWTDMHVVVLHGNVASRENILKYEWKSKLGEFDILITTYEIAMVEANLLSSICWTGVVVDEAHRLKGKNNKLGDILRKIEFGCKLLLTGTPLQNNTEELWTLLNFLQPDKFDNSEQFQVDFGDMKDSTQLERLQELLKPYMLRRMKEDVEKSLKPKEETVINVELTAMQKKFYRAVYDHNTNVFVGTDAKSLPSLMNVMMELRKCCNHPFLIRGAEQSIIAEVKERKPELKNDEMTIETLLTSSGKMVLLDKLLPKLQSQGHRVLLFSQMVRMLDIIQDYLTLRGYAFERIDGSVKVSDRQAAIERFSTPGSDRFIFLICTRAGGFGINLTAADTVIIYDSDWNPQNDIQAQARCHRIGQDKPVKVYRLITNRTYEMEMFQRANLKLGLDKAVLNPLKQTIRSDGMNEMAKMSKKEAETLLKYGAYDFFKEEREGKSEELSNAFCEADIDQILEKNTKVITIDSQGGSSFSKASFITDTSAEVDINDPNFWTKVVGLKPDQEFLGIRSHRSLSAETSNESEREGVALEDESEWNKSDRDIVLKLLLSHGWNNWEPFQQHEKLKKHPLTSIQGMAISIICQIARGQKMIDDSDKDSIRNGGLGASVKIYQQAKEAFEFLHDRYEICSVMMETIQRADSGDSEVVKLPRILPGLLRDVIWWRKEIKTTDRHLKQLSFMYQLQHCCKAFGVKIDGPVTLPAPRRAILPTPWWTMREDHDALLGVIRNGWGNWKEICSDPELCFFKEGVIYKPSKEEAKDNEKEKEKEGEKEAQEENQMESPRSPAPADGEAKIFPAATVVMKRIRRLVSTMDTMLGKGGLDEMNLDLGTMMVSPKKNRQSKGNAPLIDDWSQIELKNLRTTILRWGLPLPPSKFALTSPQLAKSREERDIITIETIQSKSEQMKMEECMAGAAACLAGVMQQLMLKESEAPSVKMEVEEEESVSPLQDATYARCWLECYPVNVYDVNRDLGLYSNKLGPYEFIRIQSKLKTKSIDRVQEMCRRIEKRVCERFQQAKEAHMEADDKKEKEKEKEKEDLTDVVPSNIVAQRLYRRIQLYYEIQQYIWDKDTDTVKSLITKWQMDGPRRQDRLSDGWDPLIHDMALLKGIRKWGFVEWELIWSYPEMPFMKPIPEKKKDDNETPNDTSAYDLANEAILSTKTVDRSIIIPGLSAAHAIRRLQSLLEMFRDYDTYNESYHFAPGEEEQKNSIQVESNPRRVVVSLGSEKRLLPQELPVTRTIYWKMNRIIPHAFPSTARSEVYRGDPSRAQISANAMQYYESWLEMDKVVQEGKYNIRKLPADVRLAIREKATQLLNNMNLPMRVRSVTILNFGQIPVNWNSYQSDKYIWPIGYKSIKSYFSYVEPSTHVEYINEILDGGVKGPIFSVTATDDPNHPFKASTATGCWSTILARVRKERARLGLGKTGTAVSGPEFFGFAMPEVAACIEGIPGSEFCRDYVCRCLRMETNRSGKSRLKFRKPKTVAVVEETHEQLAPRRAAQMASRKWKGFDSESSADFSEEESMDELSSDSTGNSSYRRRSRKRSTPPPSESTTPLASSEPDPKMIKTEQFL